MRTMTMIQDKRYVNKLILTVRFQMMSEHLIRLQQVKKQFNQLSCIEAEIVKLRQGSGKVRQGKARKGKDGER